MATVFPSDAQRQQQTSVERHLPSPGVRNSSEGPCFAVGLGMVRATPQRSLPSLLGPERPGQKWCVRNGGRASGWSEVISVRVCGWVGVSLGHRHGCCHDGGRWAAQPVDLFILWADQPVKKYKSTAHMRGRAQRRCVCPHPPEGGAGEWDGEVGCGRGMPS